MSDQLKNAGAGLVWTGRVLSGLVVLFMLFDGVTKIIREPHVVQAMAQLGYPDSLTTPLGVILLVCTAFYIIPRTSALGAILLTGWLGGAAASTLRADMPGHPYLFPVFFGILVWLGLFLRDERLRSLAPFKREV